MYLLDTNVISELRKFAAGTADTLVSAWVRNTPTPTLFTSVICIHELEHGVLMAERSDPAKGEVLRQWLDGSVIPAFAHRMLGIDLAVVRQAARLHVPNPAPFRDALIGATALVHRLVVVTRNVRDFERFDGLQVLNPWAAP